MFGGFTGPLVADWVAELLGAAELLGVAELLAVLVEVALVLSATGVGWAALVGEQAASAMTPPVSSTANLSFTAGSTSTRVHDGGS
ncbi:hypothetical protein FXN61_43745 [Lentzea sp. PSKA42]|uniref:Uncharacterized protein n=1 Tax=Lentzea indica TaxID=2604800 RepID=A0ABX1FWQ0_9PSEU|nr:hypothetical protein [Lentzea indica]NKE63274.1 hypothetical protein [Lentzea indica]